MYISLRRPTDILHQWGCDFDDSELPFIMVVLAWKSTATLILYYGIGRLFSWSGVLLFAIWLLRYECRFQPVSYLQLNTSPSCEFIAGYRTRAFIIVIVCSFCVWFRSKLRNLCIWKFIPLKFLLLLAQWESESGANVLFVIKDEIMLARLSHFQCLCIVRCMWCECWQSTYYAIWSAVDKCVTLYLIIVRFWAQYF